MNRFSLTAVLLTFSLLIACVGYRTTEKVHSPTIDVFFIREYETVTLLTTTTTTAVTTTEEQTTKLEYLDLGEFLLTAYCPCKLCSDEYGYMTATGVKAKEGRTIAVDIDVIPYGYEVVIDGFANAFVAEDCGGKVIGKHIDIFIDDHEEADSFGVRYANVRLKLKY